MQDIPLREELVAATAGRGRACRPITSLESQLTGADIFIGACSACRGFSKLGSLWCATSTILKVQRSGGGQGEGGYLSAYKTPNQYDSDCLFVGRLSDSSHFRTYQIPTKHME